MDQDTESQWQFGGYIVFSREKASKESGDLFYPDDAEIIAREIRRALNTLPCVSKILVKCVMEVESEIEEEED